MSSSTKESFGGKCITLGTYWSPLASRLASPCLFLGICQPLLGKSENVVGGSRKEGTFGASGVSHNEISARHLPQHYLFQSNIGEVVVNGVS